MISYFLAANCYGFLFFCFYLLLLRNRSSHTWNRMYLLSTPLLALVLPLIRLDIPGWYAPAVAQTLLAVSLPEVTLTAAGAADQPWYTGWSPLFAGYSLMALVLLLRLGYRMLSLRRFLNRQRWIQQDGYRLALNTGQGPASYGCTIIFPGNDADSGILAHEQAHVHYRHHYDKLLLQLLQCLFFPVIPLYLIGRELSLVHEFEADALAGQDKEQYMRTLLSEHLGFRGPALLQPFFRHPLHRRIRMLLHSKRVNNRPAKGAVLCSTVLMLFVIIYAQSIRAFTVAPSVNRSDFRYLTGVGTAPAELLPNMPAVQAQSQPAKAVAARAIREQQPRQVRPDVAPVASVPQSSAAEATAEPTATLVPADKPPASIPENKTFTSVEDMPQPPFDVMKYLRENIRYPEEAKKQSIQGRAVLQFVVDRDGSITDINLMRDIGGGCGEEAVRVVKTMPKWKPGRQAGQPVRVYYTLPVSFRLQDTEQPAINN